MGLFAICGFFIPAPLVSTERLFWLCITKILLEMDDGLSSRSHCFSVSWMSCQGFP